MRALDRILTSRKHFSVAWRRYASVLKVLGTLFRESQVSQHFTSAIYQLPEVMFNTLMQTSIGALAIQERYALVADCMFLVRT